MAYFSLHRTQFEHCVEDKGYPDTKSQRRKKPDDYLQTELLHHRKSELPETFPSKV